MKKMLPRLFKAIVITGLILISMPSFSQTEVPWGQDILWVSNKADDASTVDLLKSEGFTVFEERKYFNKLFNDIAPDSSAVDAYIDTLNSFKLIIVSNRIGGDNYFGPQSAKIVYSSTTTPMIISKVTAPANDYLQLLDTISDSQYPLPAFHEGLEAVSSETEPPFADVGFTDGKLDIRNSDTTEINFLEALSVGNGILLGKIAHAAVDSQWVWIADFAADQAAYEGASIIHKGRRVVFPFQYGQSCIMGLNTDGQAILLSLIEMLTTNVGVTERAANGLMLGTNYPNPVTDFTTINFSVRETGKVTIEVYDLMGRSIKSLVNKSYGPGEYSVQWDVKNDAGKKVPGGLYLYKMSQGSEQLTRAMIIQ
ncbi:MAG: T9SS type A sorting domain-containing protein [Bacteroidota bacterium]